MGARRGPLGRHRSWLVGIVVVAALLAACEGARIAPVSSTPPSDAPTPAPSPLAAQAVPTTAPASSPAATPPADVSPVPWPLGEPSAVWVVVRKGETLSSIASAHRIPLSVLMAANRQLAEPSRLRPGDLIAVPHVVVVVDAAMASGGSLPAARVSSRLHERTSWADVPGDLSLEAAGFGSLRSMRTLVEGVRWWYDQTVDIDGTGPLASGASVAQALGITCEYRLDGVARCGDAVWQFVDVEDPAAPDWIDLCTWPNGTRPAVFEDRWCDPAWDASGVSRNLRLVDGTFRVILTE